MVCTLKMVRSGWSDAIASRTAASGAVPPATRTNTVALGVRLRAIPPAVSGRNTVGTGMAGSHPDRTSCVTPTTV